MRMFRPTLFLLLSLLALQAGARTRKTVFVIVDGIPADVIERLRVPSIVDISFRGIYSRMMLGGETGWYNETPTISAVGYNTALTGTWANKHNVWNNSGQHPNYNYWSMFKVAKSQDHPVTTAIYSGWTDNRTVLLGEGLPATGHLEIDFVRDGYDLDKVNFPDKEQDLHVFDYDEKVTEEAVKGIREDAPDLSWVYLWYTDDAGHLKGNGSYMDEYVLRAGEQIGRIWEAVRYRESRFKEEWLVIVVTDHGRAADGHSHGGQSLREKTSWVAANVKANRKYLATGCLALVDVAPTIYRFMGWTVPEALRREMDGSPFIGKLDIAGLEALEYDDYSSVILTWKILNKGAVANIFMTASNNFKDGGTDDWVKVGSAKASDGTFTISLKDVPRSGVYKFAVETPNGTLTRWVTGR